MLSPQELFRNIVYKPNIRYLSPKDTYVLLEALVEAVDPEKHICGDCRYFQQKPCPIWYAVQRGLSCSLFEAKLPVPVVEPEDTDVCEGCNWSRTVWCSVRDRVVSKGLTPPCLSEDTDAAFRKLRVERNDLRVAPDGWEQGCAEAEHELAKAQAEIERLAPLAELGELVRGMRDDSSLRHVASRYHTFTYAGSGWGRIISADDPAEALRSIQEVGDDPG